MRENGDQLIHKSNRFEQILRNFYKFRFIYFPGISVAGFR